MLKRYLLTLCAAIVACVASHAAVYGVGTFNGWNINSPLVFDEADGLYSATIDFTENQQFKISTADPKGSWDTFDTGTLAYGVTPQLNQWAVLKSQPNSGNMTAPAAEKLVVTVDLNAMMIRFSRPGYSSEPYSETLPVFFINTEGGVGITSKEDYVQATYWLDPMGIEGVEAIGSKEAPLTTQIKGRGNWSWLGFNKKPYRLKLDKKQPLLGMPSSKHWALMAQADDNLGMLRNVTGFAASRLLGMPWTPGDQPCEVVLNGDYIGMYFLTQIIRVDKDRVNIVEQADEATTDVDGGWLVEIDNYDTDPHITIYENGNSQMPIWFTYKSPEILSTEQSDYLTTAMQNIDNAIYKNGSNSAPLQALVDFDIAARYYIVQEIMDDSESYHGSCYLNRNRGAAEKWMFGPVWDFGNAYQRQNYRQFIWQNPSFSQVWIGGIYQFEEFQKTVKKVWADFLNNGPQDLNAAVTAMANRIAVAADYDYLRWPSYGTNQEMQKCTTILQKMNDKIDWLKTQWGAEPSEVSDITVDSDDAMPVEYYNLQGVRLANPAAGQIVIRRQGTTVTKLLIK